MIRGVWLITFSIPLVSAAALAQEQNGESTTSAPAQVINPFEAVRSGNKALEGGDAAAALEHYRQARQSKPVAREIAFDEGLAHQRLGEFDLAREAFERAAAGTTDALADDALYGRAACDHTKALGTAQSDPKQALSLLENAMQGYRGVLANRPEHVAARDADLKAATLWRQLKQLQQQEQQQQQQSDSEQQQENEESEEQQEKQQSSSEQNESQEKNQQQNSDSQESQEQSKEQQESKDEQTKKEDQSSESKDQQQEDQQQAQAAQPQDEQEASHEQAERKLREMMQAVRERKKDRREMARPLPLAPVEKDW